MPLYLLYQYFLSRKAHLTLIQAGATYVYLQPKQRLARMRRSAAPAVAPIPM